MTNENLTDETVEEVVEEVIPDEDIQLDPVMDRIHEMAGTGPYAEAKEEVEEVVEEAEEVVDNEVEEVEPTNGVLFTTDDGTEVTLEEARKGFLRQSDYTRKTQGIAEEKKQIEQNRALLDYIANDPALLKKVTDHIGGSREPEKQDPGIQVPDAYKDDDFVKQLVAVVNEVKGDVTKVKGGYDNITQESQAKQEQSAFTTKLNTRLESAYNGLKGQVETPPTTQEFGKAIQAYFVEHNIDPGKGAYEIANSVDPNYLPGIVARIYNSDISKATKTETAVVEKNRKKNTAKGATLRVAGKSTQTPKPSLPKLPDGKLDRSALVRQMITEQNKQQQG